MKASKGINELLERLPNYFDEIDNDPNKI